MSQENEKRFSGYEGHGASEYPTDLQETAAAERANTLYDLMLAKLKAIPACDLRAAFADFPKFSVDATIERLKREGVIEVIQVSEITDKDLYFQGDVTRKQKKS